MKAAHQNQRTNEQGFVAIVITMVMLIIITVIVLGFAQTVRRDQRAELDRQLSSRAFYAAESGVNLARKAIAANASFSKDTCEPLAAGDPSGLDQNGYTIEGSTNAAVTCLTVSPYVSEQVYTKVTDQSTIFPIESKAGADINTVTFKWKASSGTAGNCTTQKSPRFPQSGSWDCGPLLRMDIVNLSGASFTRDELTNNAANKRTATFFFYPLDSGAASVGFTQANDITGANAQGRVVNTNCGSSQCIATVDLTGLGAGNQKKFAVRVLSLYQDAADLRVTMDDGTSDKLMKGAQAVIDSTAKSQDVLRRIRVTVPLSGASDVDVPDWAVAGGAGVCKRYKVDDTSVIIDPTYSGDATCKLAP